MKKKLFFIAALAITSFSSFAQHTWYNSGASTSVIDLATGGGFGATITSGNTNPKTTGIYTESTASIVTRYGSAGSNSGLAKNGMTLRFTKFDVSVPGAMVANGGENPLIMKLKVYIPDFDNVPGNSFTINLRKNNNAANEVKISKGMADNDGWKEYTLDFSAATLKAGGTLEDEYNTLIFSFGGGKPTNDFEYYLDDITANFSISTSLSANSVDFNSNEFKLYQNPVLNELVLSKEAVSVGVYDMLGKKVKSFNQRKANYDVSDLPQGVYVLLANFENTISKSLRFIKE